MEPQKPPKKAEEPETITCHHCRYERPATDTHCHICGYPWDWKPPESGAKAKKPSPRRPPGRKPTSGS